MMRARLLRQLLWSSLGILLVAAVVCLHTGWQQQTMAQPPVVRTTAELRQDLDSPDEAVRLEAIDTLAERFGG